MNLSVFRELSLGLLLILPAVNSHGNSKDRRVTAVGRFTIITRQPLKKKRVWLHFNSRLSGRYAAYTDDSGYFRLRLHDGVNHLALLEYRGGEPLDFYKNIADSVLTVSVGEGEETVYIGDIEIPWTLRKEDARGAVNPNGGALGAAAYGIAATMREAKRNPADTPVFTVRESQTTLTHFQEALKTQIQVKLATPIAK